MPPDLVKSSRKSPANFSISGPSESGLGRLSVSCSHFGGVRDYATAARGSGDAGADRISGRSQPVASMETILPIISGIASALFLALPLLGFLSLFMLAETWREPRGGSQTLVLTILQDFPLLRVRGADPGQPLAAGRGAGDQYRFLESVRSIRGRGPERRAGRGAAALGRAPVAGSSRPP